MLRLLFALALFSSPAFAGEVFLGPSGGPSVEPFHLNDEYAADFANAVECSHEGTVRVLEGDKAVYKEENGAVNVMLDEFARRTLLDYCWNE